MNLAFADRDFYYGDPYVPPEEPIKGLLSKDYAKARFGADQLGAERSRRQAGRSVSVPRRDESVHRAARASGRRRRARARPTPAQDIRTLVDEGFYAGTTSIQAADEEGWVVSVTPSGGWVPAVIAGKTGIGLSQRMQASSSTRPTARSTSSRRASGRASTLTPTLALKDGKPYLAFAVQGGDSQDQNLLQFFLNMVEFGMTVQQAVEAPNINSFQMRELLRPARRPQPGRMLVAESTPPDGAQGSCRRWATR